MCLQKGYFADPQLAVLSTIYSTSYLWRFLKMIANVHKWTVGIEKYCAGLEIL